MSRSNWIVIPFRGPEGAKSRLAHAMPEDERRALARAMFQHVLMVAVQAAGPERVLVVTPSRAAALMAGPTKATVLRERAGDLNGALEETRAFLRKRNAETMTIVAADLPLVQPEEIADLLAWARPGKVMIGLDRRRTGTNVLSLPTATTFRFRFGLDSATAHTREAAAHGLMMRPLRNGGFRADVDVPDDLALLREPNALSALRGLSARVYRGMR